MNAVYSFPRLNTKMSARNRKRARMEEESEDEYEASSSAPSQRIKVLDSVMTQDWDAEVTMITFETILTFFLLTWIPGN